MGIELKADLTIICREIRHGDETGFFDGPALRTEAYRVALAHDMAYSTAVSVVKDMARKAAMDYLLAQMAHASVEVQA